MYILHQLGVEPVPCPHAARVSFEGKRVIYRCSLPGGHPGQHADQFARGEKFTWDTPEKPVLVRLGDL